MSYDEDIIDSQANEKKTFKKYKQHWKVESGEDFENAYQMERDGFPWGGGYNEDSRNFIKNYASTLWGDKVEKSKTKKQQTEKPKEAELKKATPKKAAPKKAAPKKAAPKKAAPKKAAPKKEEKQKL